MAKDETMDIKDKKGKVGGKIIFNQLKMDMRPSLVDYLRQGWKMDVSIAIDFTLSNMEITDYRSLHRMNQGDMNQYEKAIFEVCNVMMPYAQQGMFKAYGFGGIPIYTGVDKVSRLWNLNGLKNAQVRETSGVLEAYQKAIHGTKLAGPSYFGSLLDKIKNEIHVNI